MRIGPGLCIAVLCSSVERVGAELDDENVVQVCVVSEVDCAQSRQPKAFVRDKTKRATAQNREDGEYQFIRNSGRKSEVPNWGSSSCA